MSRKMMVEKWGMSLSTVKELTNRADFPEAIVLGGSLRWDEDEVESWLANRPPRRRRRVAPPRVAPGQRPKALLVPVY